MCICSISNNEKTPDSKYFSYIKSMEYKSYIYHCDIPGYLLQTKWCKTPPYIFVYSVLILKIGEFFILKCKNWWLNSVDVRIWWITHIYTWLLLYTNL